MRRALAGGVLVVTLVTSSLAPVGAAPDTASGPRRVVLRDRDGDRVDDVLERRMRSGAADARHAVVVATDGSIGLRRAHAVAGAFAVSRALEIVHGFSARMTAGQVHRLAATPGVLRIDHDAVVRIAMDAARSDFGVEAVRTTLGLTGAGVNVCILDTGVDATHEQLDARPIVWEDFVGGATEPYDDHGHGTHVASIAVGDGVGGPVAARFGGVAPGAGLWAGKVLDGGGSGSESGIVAGIDWCAADPDVDVISMSLGTVFPSDGSDALSIAADNAVAAGKVVVAAAGNSGDGPDSIAAPGAAADVITVGAVSDWSAAPGAANHSDGVYLAPFSGRGGPTFEGDMKPDVVSPGVTITAADANTGAGYATFSGTSMATPFATGSAALALQAEPDWSAEDLQAAMEATAEDFGAAGKDPDWGAGLLDVHALAAAASGGTGETSFPAHAHIAAAVPDGGEWMHAFEIAQGDLAVPIAATIVLDGECQLFFPGFGCLDPAWSPDLDAELLDPNGSVLALSRCMDDTECGTGRQETLHAMPTVAGTYRIRVYAYLGSPNDGLGGTFELDLSTGPAGSVDPPSPPPTPTMHVGDLDASSVTISSTRWRARVVIRVHDEAEAGVAGVTVSGRWGTTGSVTCTTGSAGACALKRSLRNAKLKIVFTVRALSKTSYAYASAANHDPDGDSNGTKITVTRP